MPDEKNVKHGFESRKFKIPDYKIVDVKKVNDFLSDGYDLVGGPFVYQGMLLQAVMKWDTETLKIDY